MHHLLAVVVGVIVVFTAFCFFIASVWYVIAHYPVYCGFAVLFVLELNRQHRAKRRERDTARL